MPSKSKNEMNPEQAADHIQTFIQDKMPIDFGYIVIVFPTKTNIRYDIIEERTNLSPQSRMKVLLAAKDNY